MKHPRCARAIALLGILLPFAGNVARSAEPQEGDCPTISGRIGADEGAVDAAPVTLREGMVVSKSDLLALRTLLPQEIWSYREIFFHEGMRMEIGPCHRRYPAASFYQTATEAHRGKPRLDRNGNLRNYEAGLPFPPETIDPEADDAALRWAWNLERRYRGSGHRGSFRITDFPSSLGGVQVYEGDFFLLQTRYRSDLPDEGYELADTGRKIWAAGGAFVKPYNARHLAWRQFRQEAALRKYMDPDDTFVYVPTMRKMRRASATWSDGLYFPRYTVSGDSGGGGMPVAAGAVNPTAGQSIAVSEDARRGFTGLVLRPNAYVWRSHGEVDVIAPLNGSQLGYPAEPNRNFGYSGLSVASDRWDVRRAVVIEGAARNPQGEVRTVTIYVDRQTQQPLYWITRGSKRRLVEIGVLVHRFSGDVAHYPEWPGGVPASVFEPVAAVFYNVLAGGGGWRRESYDLLSLPFSESERRMMLSSDRLDRGR